MKTRKLVLEPRFYNFHSDLCESAQFVADSLQLRRSSLCPGRYLVPEESSGINAFLGSNLGVEHES